MPRVSRPPPDRPGPRDWRRVDLLDLREGDGLGADDAGAGGLDDAGLGGGEDLVLDGGAVGEAEVDGLVGAEGLDVLEVDLDLAGDGGLYRQLAALGGDDGAGEAVAVPEEDFVGAGGGGGGHEGAEKRRRKLWCDPLFLPIARWLSKWGRVV